MAEQYEVGGKVALITGAARGMERAAPMQELAERPDERAGEEQPTTA